MNGSVFSVLRPSITRLFRCPYRADLANRDPIPGRHSRTRLPWAGFRQPFQGRLATSEFMCDVLEKFVYVTGESAF